MILNINFEGSGVFDRPLNKEVNGLINRCLGENNKYHGKFSNYCISQMQGGKMNKEGLNAISGLVIIVNHYVITKVGWNISIPHKLYIIVIYNVIS